MQTQNYLSFKAKYITYTNIKNTSTSPNQLQKVDVIELIPSDDNDLETMYSVSKSWRQNISSALYKSFISSKPYLKEHYYALSLPQDTYDKSNPDNILGVCLISERDNNIMNLDFLQTNPKYMYSNKTLKNYQKIGTTLLNFLKEQYNFKKIRVISLEDAKEFYRKNDFIPLGKDYDNPCMMWNI